MSNDTGAKAPDTAEVVEKTPWDVTFVAPMPVRQEGQFLASQDASEEAAKEEFLEFLDKHSVPRATVTIESFEPAKIAGEAAMEAETPTIN